MTVVTYEEMKEQNAFIQADLKRINEKIIDLSQLITEYTKEKKLQLEDIQEFMHDFNNQLIYDDHSICQLIDLEKIIDRIEIEIKEKKLIERVRYLLDSALDCIDYHIGKKQETIGLRALKGDLKNILDIIDSRKEFTQWRETTY